MNILNKGRCSRCIASEQKEIKVGSLIQGNFKIRIWRYCKKHNQFCRYCSGRCKESPMGVKIV